MEKHPITLVSFIFNKDKIYVMLKIFIVFIDYLFFNAIQINLVAYVFALG